MMSAAPAPPSSGQCGQGRLGAGVSCRLCPGYSHTEEAALLPSLALHSYSEPVTHLSSSANTIYLSSMGMVMTALVILVMATLMSGSEARVSMIQSRACYYQRHNRELVCQCREDNTHLHLKLREFINARQEVRSKNS